MQPVFSPQIAAGKTTALVYTGGTEQRGPQNVNGGHTLMGHEIVKAIALRLGNAIFLISRLPGLIAHAHEERARQSPMRQIDPKDNDYDGSRERRLPEGRK